MPTNIPGMRDIRSGSNIRTGQVAVRMISAPAEIIPERRPARVHGDIQSVGENGRVRIATDKGDIVIQAREGVARQLQQGQQVEVEIPPENFDRQARIREAPADPSSGQRPGTSVEHTPSRDQTGRISAPAPGVSGARQVRPPDLPQSELISRPEAPVSDSRSQALNVLSEGQVVRLTRLPDQAVQMLVPPEEIPVHMTTVPSLLVATDGNNITNERFLQAIGQQAQSNLFQNIAQIFGTRLPATANLGQLDLEGFILTSRLSKPAQINAMAANLVNIQTISTDRIASPIAAASQTNLQNKTDQPPLQTFLDNLGNRYYSASLKGPAQQPASVSQGGIMESIATNIVPRRTEIGSITGQQATFGGLNNARGYEAFKTAGGNASQSVLGQISSSQGLFNNSAGGQVAQIIGQTRDSLPVFQVFSGGDSGFSFTPMEGLFTPNVSIGSLPTGTIVPLQPLPADTLTGLSATISPLPASIPAPIQPGQWPGFTQLHQTLFGSQTQSAHANAALTPNPATPAQLGPAAMFFISAVQGGDIGAWLGNLAQNALKQGGKSNVVEMLSQDLRGAQTAERGAQTPSEWRTHIFPLLWDGEIQKVALWSRPERDPDAENDEMDGDKKATRFVLDLDLLKMGSVQIDGLVRPQKLDIVLRSEAMFSPSMRQTMRRGYIKALEETSYSGELHFHARPQDKQKIDLRDKNWSDLV